MLRRRILKHIKKRSKPQSSIHTGFMMPDRKFPS